MIHSTKTLLKGGSLAGTYLISGTDGTFVRKEISLRKEREYGYQRWYSQLKRLQRYELLFPSIFAKVIRYGIEGDRAFFDLEHYANYHNCWSYLMQCDDKEEIEKIFNLIIRAMNIVHSKQLPSCPEALHLYYEEEIIKKIKDCFFDEEFSNYYNRPTIKFHGKLIPSLSSLLQDYRQYGFTHYTSTTECYTHGNITLENILYSPKDNKVIFIDPYEENIIDNIYNEYSQILQSCNSHYEIYNASNGQRWHDGKEGPPIPLGISYFNILFLDFMKKTLSEDEIKMVKYFEVSQFIRMLPFKMKGDRDKMFLFYGLASYLAGDLLKE